MKLKLILGCFVTMRVDFQLFFNILSSTHILTKKTHVWCKFGKHISTVVDARAKFEKYESFLT